MLSRVADSLYWMSRYLERAEHTARLLNVHLHGLLDQKADLVAKRWERVFQSLYVEMPHTPGAQPLVLIHGLVHALMFDAGLPGSIVGCIATARQNAREVREHISSEMWEQVNRLFLTVKLMKQSDIRDGHAYGFFQAVKEGSHLFQGITDATISHSQGWYFIQLGRYIERVLATVRLLENHYHEYAVHNGIMMGDTQYMEWADLLKSCTAFEAYCRTYTANIEPAHATSFLVLHRVFPHSVRFGVGAIRRALEALSDEIPHLKSSEALRLAGKLTAMLQYDSVGEIMQQNVRFYLRGIRGQCVAIHEAVYDCCISYPVEQALPV